ncbi:MAG: hypothetical protein WBM36_00950 [Lysobacterales bacterium]
MSPMLNKEDFSSLGDEAISLREASSGLSFSASLGTVETLKSHGPREDAFSVSFLVSTPENLEQGIYEFDHPYKGSVEIFLVPVARRENHLELEAVFN